jgi:beta-lactamase class A
VGKIYHKLRSKSVSQFNYQSGVRRSHNVLLPVALVATVFCLGAGVTFGLAIFKGSSPESSPVARESVVTTAIESHLKEDKNLNNLKNLNKQDKELESEVNKIINSFPDDEKWSVYVQDLDSTRSLSINPERSYDSGSLYKLFLLSALEQKVTPDKWESWWVTNSNVKYCVSAMLSEIDDEYCAKAIGNLVKWENADNVNHDQGYGQTKLIESKPQTTARDVGTLLASMKRGKTLNDITRRIAFDSLYELKKGKGIASACNDCRTANKTAQTAENAHDAGIVTRGNKSYVVVIMSQNGNSAQIAKIAKAIDKVLGR